MGYRRLKDSQEIYVAQNGEVHGPFQREDVREMLKTGAVELEDFGMGVEMEEWVPLGELFESGDLKSNSKGLDGNAIREALVASFPLQLILSFVHPLRGSGLAILVAGTVAYTMGSILFWVPILGPIFNLLVTAYFVAYLFDIIRSSAVGDEELPMFPGLDAFWDNVLIPFLKVCWIFVFYLVPGFLAFYILQDAQVSESEVSRLLMIGGLALVPMALLRVAVLNTLISGINIFAVLLAVSRVFFWYLIVLCLLGLLYFVWETGDEFLSKRPWFVRIPALTLFVFYVLAVKARLIGVIYKNRGSMLRWLG